MARIVDRLNALQCKAITGPTKICDGGGLWLYVSPTNARNWVFRYRLNGRDREMGLGSLPDITLKVARQHASDCRALKRKGIDPIIHRDSEKVKQTQRTFADCVDEYIESKQSEWKNAKHRQQWRNTLTTYAIPKIGKFPIESITSKSVESVLRPIWETKTETATRVRQRMEKILDFAKTKKYRTGDNPAIWQGGLENIFSKPSKIKKVRHHPALHYSKIAHFMQKLRHYDMLSAATLEFTILTACRTSEVINATWDEFDIEKNTWTIPGERMKAGEIHRVPLTESTITLLNKQQAIRLNQFVFPGRKADKPISNISMLKHLKQTMGYSNLTVHGFRSTFRDWCAEQTNYPREVAEAALAHTLSNKTEAAYQRGDLFEKRRELMQAWDKYSS